MPKEKATEVTGVRETERRRSFLRLAPSSGERLTVGMPPALSVIYLGTIPDASHQKRLPFCGECASTNGRYVLLRAEVMCTSSTYDVTTKPITLGRLEDSAGRRCGFHGRPVVARHAKTGVTSTP